MAGGAALGCARPSTTILTTSLACMSVNPFLNAKLRALRVTLSGLTSAPLASQRAATFCGVTGSSSVSAGRPLRVLSGLKWSKAICMTRLTSAALSSLFWANLVAEERTELTSLEASGRLWASHCWNTSSAMSLFCREGNKTREDNCGNGPTYGRHIQTFHLIGQEPTHASSKTRLSLLRLFKTPPNGLIPGHFCIIVVTEIQRWQFTMTAQSLYL